MSHVLCGYQREDHASSAESHLPISVTFSTPTPDYASYHRVPLERACYLSALLLREVHTPHQSLKARFGTQSIPTRIGFNVDHLLNMLFVSPLHPSERPVLFAETYVCVH